LVELVKEKDGRRGFFGFLDNGVSNDKTIGVLCVGDLSRE
jgi:hypothetical protein